MTMNKTETELFENMSKTVADAIVKGQQQNQMNQNQMNYSRPQVSRAVDNPLLWVSFLGAVLGIVGILLVFVYNLNQNGQNTNITANKTAIDAMNHNIDEVQKSVQQIQTDQKSVTESVKDLVSSVKDISDNQSEIKSSRFKGTDFPVYIKPFGQRLDIVENELEKRTETINDVKYLKDEIVDMRARIKILEAD